MKKVFITLFLAFSLQTIVFSQHLTVYSIAIPDFCNNCAGAFVVEAAGGVPPHLYSIYNIVFQPSNTFTGSCVGIYVVTVKDDEENFVNDIIEIVNITPLLLSISITPSGKEASGVAELFVENGYPPYLYSINNGEPSTQNIFSDLPPDYCRAVVIDTR
jgi:hypothetical protein